jgi:hypothetical protein
LSEDGRSAANLDPSSMSDTTDRLPDTGVRFARSATRHRVSKDRIRHVIANYSVRFEESPPEGGSARAIRIVYLGEDTQGQVLEVMAVEMPNGDLLVIHAMPMRSKYGKKYEQEAGK